MLKKTALIFSCFFTLAALVSFTPAKRPADPGNTNNQQPVKTVIIDAGHGIMADGHYNGAAGSYSHEDDICLAVAKKLVKEIGETYPNIRIVETRPTKYITGLHERADIANRNKGDLFISIHVNAMPPLKKREFTGYRTEVYYTGKGRHKKRHSKKVATYRYYEVPDVSAKGTQTYIWGAHKTEDKEVAIRENAPIFAEENYQEKYGTIDVNSPDFVALSLVKTQQFARRSTMLANMVEDEFAKVGRISGGAHQRQVGIWVLQATAMPSVLVETGFITNPQEEDYLNSENGQQEIADCITKALGSYIGWIQKKQQSAALGTAGNDHAPGKTDHNAYNFLQAIDRQEKKRTSK